MAPLLPGLAIHALGMILRGWLGGLVQTTENLGHSGTTDAEVASQSGTILHRAAVEKTLVELGQSEGIAVHTGLTGRVFTATFRDIPGGDLEGGCLT
jgi:hypothetical protein